MRTNVLKKTMMVIIASFPLTSGTTSCTKTEVSDLQAPEDISQEIVLNLSRSDFGGTRADDAVAHAGHKLRFTAKLYSGTFGDKNGGETPSFQETKQALADNNATQTIIFTVPQGKYSILLFADYIPSESQADDSGIYPDCYYNTYSNNENDGVDMITKVTNRSYLNNENYDCFCGWISVEKKEAEVEEDIILQRPVSRVSFVSSTDPLTDIDNISVSIVSASIKLASLTSRSSPGDPGMISGSTIKPSETEPNELFFYYTFAIPKDSGRTSLNEFKFIVNYKNEGESQESQRIWQNGINSIYAYANHKVKVKGAFYQDVEPEKGDIILNLSTNSDWTVITQELDKK